MKSRQGFTVIEVVVVVAIIGILASVVIFNASRGNARSRDIDRQADLRTLQSAIELYKQRYGRYPAQCARANPAAAGVWSGQSGTNFACVSGEQYIMGHVDTTDSDRDGNTTERFTFAPEFIQTLPTDKKIPDANSGYVYTVSADGAVYKLQARRTVETETVTYSHPFRNCDQSTSAVAICDGTSVNNPWGGSTPNQCLDNDTSGVFQKTYAVWGGYARTGDVEQQTEIVVCQ